MATASELRKELYDRGEFGKCLEEVTRELHERPADDLERGELLALGAWCYYRRNEFAEAKKWAEQAGQVRFARECLAYIAAYAKGFKDDTALYNLARELGDSVNVQNALTIRARESDSVLTHEDVMNGTLCYRENTVEVANLFHNAARFFLSKLRSDEDLLLVLGFLDAALTRYGIDRNWHHRGAANFWRSKALEALLDKRAALEAARDSLFCWTQQMILDPGNERNMQQWENAVQRVRDLLK
ncbi:MAG: hypothetical protein Q8M00_02445 [bacterium]|nr:hypothetical protein [bacterium]